MPTTPPQNIVAIRETASSVEDVLARRLGSVRAQLDGVSPDAGAMADSLDLLVKGGKRLRAQFCDAAWRAEGGTTTHADSPAIIAGAALEFFQAAALIHDDIMDESDRRRGNPSTHKHFEHLHSSGPYGHRAQKFGESAGILIGDLALVEANTTMRISLEAVGADARTQAGRIFDLMQAEVTIGQFLDVQAQVSEFGVDPEIDLARAMTIIRAKSARYSVEHPMTLGAALAGAEADRLEMWSAFGLPLGEAFQLRDDVLGVFGSAKETGKPSGDDLREGKRTVMIAFTMAHADDIARQVVKRSLGQPGLREEDVDRLRGIIESSGALAKVESLIAELSARADAALEQLGLSPSDQLMLQTLADAAIHRTR